MFLNCITEKTDLADYFRLSLNLETTFSISVGGFQVYIHLESTLVYIPVCSFVMKSGWCYFVNDIVS